MKKILLSASLLAVVGAGEVWSQAVYFGQGCSPAPRPALAAAWNGGAWQIGASWGGGWGGGYAAPVYCAPVVRPVVVPVWTGGFNCAPATVVNYYGSYGGYGNFVNNGTTYRRSSTFVVPRRYGAAPTVADPVFRASALVSPVRAVTLVR
jgi:hypothetical protein